MFIVTAMLRLSSKQQAVHHAQKEDTHTTTPSRSIAVYVLLLCCGAFLPACTTVHVSGSQAKVTRGFGIINIEIQPDNRAPLMVATEGVGIVAASKSVTIGAMREFTVSLPDASACHTVIVVQNNQEFNSLHQLLSSKPESLNHLCIATKEKITWTP